MAEEQVIETVNQEPETPAPTPTEPPSRVDQIREGLAKAKEAAGDVEGAKQTRRGLHAQFQPRDGGKFAPGKPDQQKAAKQEGQSLEASKQKDGAVGQTPAPQRPAYPKSWPKEHAKAFETLDPQFATALAQLEDKRNQDVQNGISQYKQKADQYDELAEVFKPYEATIRAEGGTMPTAMRELLNTAYILRAGSPTQKAQLVAGTMAQFGVDPNHVWSVLTGNQQALPQQDPRYDQLNQRFQALERSLQGQQQQQEEALMGQIEQYATQPGHEHLDALTPSMIQLLEAGMAKDLDDAYQKALRLDPQLFEQVAAAQRQTDELRKREEANKAALAARSSAAQVRGAPSGAVGQSPNPADRRATIANALREASR